MSISPDIVPLAPLTFTFEDAVPAPSKASKINVRIAAHSDAEAVGQWLMEYRDSPRTFRHYRKEAERLLLWLAEHHLTLATTAREHLDAFDRFLANPVPRERWVGSVSRRSDPAWRPFRGPLSPSSRRQSLVILQGMFSWLLEAGWIAHNPFRLMRNKHHKLDHQTSRIERYLERPLWRWLWQWLQRPPLQRVPSAHFAAARRRFAVGFGYMLAPRLSEMAQARMSDFTEREGRWWWRVVGKGNKSAYVPLPPTMQTLLAQWRCTLSLPSRPLPEEDTPVLRALNGQDRISDNQLYRLLRQTFTEAAQALEAEGGETRYVTQLYAATPHWLRHTALTHQAQAGVEMRYLAQTARHARLETTARYLHTEDEEWHEQLARHGHELLQDDGSDK